MWTCRLCNSRTIFFAEIITANCCALRILYRIGFGENSRRRVIRTLNRIGETWPSRTRLKEWRASDVRRVLFQMVSVNSISSSIQSACRCEFSRAGGTISFPRKRAIRCDSFPILAIRHLWGGTETEGKPTTRVILGNIRSFNWGGLRMGDGTLFYLFGDIVLPKLLRISGPRRWCLLYFSTRITPGAVRWKRNPRPFQKRYAVAKPLIRLE